MEQSNHVHVDIDVRVSQEKRCFITAKYGPESHKFWIDFSETSIDIGRVPYYGAEVALGWYIAMSKRVHCDTMSIRCSHEAREAVIDMWSLLSEVEVTDLKFDHKWPAIPTAWDDRKRFCISWGGGKDSYAALNIIKETVSPDEIYLFDFAVNGDGDTAKRRIRRRSELTMMPSCARFDASPIAIYSNASSQFTMPNSIIYFAFLPMLDIEYGIDTFCYSFESMFFVDGRGKYRFSSGRQTGYDPARTLAAKLISQSMSRVAGRTFNIFNANYQFTELSAFEYVARYVDRGLDSIMMCEIGGDDKWCLKCTKCAQLTIYCFAMEIPQSQIDTEKFLIESPWVHKAIDNIKGSLSPWYKGLSYPGHIDSFRYILGQISDDHIASLSSEAADNLRLIRDGYGSNEIKNENGIFAKNLFAQWPEQYAADVFAHLKSKLPVYDSPEFEKNWGNARIYRNEEKQAVDRAIQYIAYLQRHAAN